MDSIERIFSHPALAEAEILRLRAQLQQRWKPIETAPKEPRWQDGKNHYSDYMIAWYPGALRPLRVRWWEREDTGSCNFIADGGYAVFPTHWMKLPEPPNGKN